MSRYIKLVDALRALADTCYLDEIDENMQKLPSIDLADYVPKDFHDKTCEAMAKRHTEEIQRLMPKREEWIDRPPMSNLKPCPFCGRDVELRKVPLWKPNGRGYFGCFEYVIQCNDLDCGCKVNLHNNDTVYRDDETARMNAIKAWNRRADDE